MNQERTPPHPRDVVIINAIRTPLCRARKGGLAKVPPSTLLATAFQGCLSPSILSKGTSSTSTSSTSMMNHIQPSDIQDICVGNVLSPNSGHVTMRMAQLSAGIPSSVPLHTTNRQCSSGLQAVATIAHAIASGSIDIGIGAGVESMSTHPMHKMSQPNVDWDVMNSCGNNGEVMDCLTPMGVTSENVSKKYGLTRKELDEFAAKSHVKAARAQERGLFQEEIVQVGNVAVDDGIRPNTTAEKLGKLKPVFDEKGSTTAGNSSQLTDGAAAVLLCSRQEAQRRNLPILATWRSFAVKGVPPRIMGIGPAVAIPAAIQSANANTNTNTNTNSNLHLSDIDIFEINEAFASQAHWCVQELQLDPSKVNPNGGAIALGHPLGCTGARQIATLVHEMHRKGKRYGVVSMCIGTGMGAAAVIEVEQKRWSSL